MHPKTCKIKHSNAVWYLFWNILVSSPSTMLIIQPLWNALEGSGEK